MLQKYKLTENLCLVLALLARYATSSSSTSHIADNFAVNALRPPGSNPKDPIPHGINHTMTPSTELEDFHQEQNLKQRLRFERQVNATNPELWHALRFQRQLLPGETYWQRPDIIKELHAEFKRQTVLKFVQFAQRQNASLWRAYQEKLQRGEPLWSRHDLLEELTTELLSQDARQVKRRVEHLNRTIWHDYEQKLRPGETMAQRRDLVEQAKVDYRRQLKWQLPFIVARSFTSTRDEY